MDSSNESKEGHTKETKSDFLKVDLFETTSKSEEVLDFLRHKEEHEYQIKSKESLKKPNERNPTPKGSKINHTKPLALFKSNSNFNLIDELGESEERKKTNKTSIALGTQNYQIEWKINIGKKSETENIRPVSSVLGVSLDNENTKYQKLHDKLNYLEKKIIEMKLNLEKKRIQKKKNLDNKIQSKGKKSEKGYQSENIEESKADSLKNIESQVTHKTDFSAMDFDQYSQKSNIYYVTEVVRTHKDENSIARDHLVGSLQLLKMLGKSQVPSNEEMAARALIFPKKPIHQEKKTVIFDLDETLIHCNENASMPSDIKLPIQFPTGDIIYVGINIRPYALELLKELSKSFEIFVFTASHSCYANAVLNYLDPEGKYISHRLYREHCYCISEGVHVKDLRVINRDLSQTVLVDNAAYSFAFQIDNGIPIIPYYEGKVDFELKALQVYLESILLCNDVREVNKNTFALHRYKEFESPLLLIKELYSHQFR